MPSAATQFRYALGTCLQEGERDAVYETEYEGKPAVVRFTRPETTFDSAKLVSQYAAAAKLRHPNLVQIFDYGEAEIFETPVVFMVSERGENSLPADTRGQIASALQFLHSNGYAHGAVAPASIVSVSETAKLSSDCIHLASEGQQEEDRTALSSLPGNAESVAGAVPLYRKHAGLAIGGLAGAGLLVLMLVRNAEHKPAPLPVPAPVFQAQQPVVEDLRPAKAAPAPRTHSHKKARAKHKRR